MADASYTPVYIHILEGAITQTLVAGEDVALGKAVYIAADGQANLCDANAEATADFFGLVVAVQGIIGETTAAAGQAIEVCTYGPVSGFSGLTPGARLFVSENAGGLTETAPSGAGTWTRTVASNRSSAVIFIDPQVAVVAEGS